MMATHKISVRIVTASKNPPWMDVFSSVVITHMNETKLSTQDIEVRRPGKVFKYPGSIMVETEMIWKRGRKIDLY